MAKSPIEEVLDYGRNKAGTPREGYSSELNWKSCGTALFIVGVVLFVFVSCLKSC